MGLWTTYKRREQLSRVRLHVLAIERVKTPQGTLRGKIVLETDASVLAEVVFRFVREEPPDAHGKVRTVALATARHGAVIALRAREPVVVEFAVPYDLTPVWPLAWRLPQVLPTGEIAAVQEAYFLEACIDTPDTVLGARDRVPLQLTAA